MAALRVEADESSALAEEMKAKVKTLEQENLSKDQEISSLTHKNQLLESEVEKLESGIKDAKKMAEESGATGREAEGLQRRLQVLEVEAEAADSNVRDTNEKYVSWFCCSFVCAMFWLAGACHCFSLHFGPFDCNKMLI